MRLLQGLSTLYSLSAKCSSLNYLYSLPPHHGKATTHNQRWPNTSTTSESQRKTTKNRLRFPITSDSEYRTATYGVFTDIITETNISSIDQQYRKQKSLWIFHSEKSIVLVFYRNLVLNMLERQRFKKWSQTLSLDFWLHQRSHLETATTLAAFTTPATAKASHP